MRNWRSGRSNAHLRTSPRPREQSTPTEDTSEGTNSSVHPISVTSTDSKDDQSLSDHLYDSEEDSFVIQKNDLTSTHSSSDSGFYPFDAILSHRTQRGQFQVLVDWTDDTQTYHPTWEPLGNIAESSQEETVDYARQHNLLELWSEYIITSNPGS